MPHNQQQQHPNNNHHNGDDNDTTTSSSDTSNPTNRNTGQQQYPSLLGFFLLYVHEEVVFRPLIWQSLLLKNCYQPGTLLEVNNSDVNNEENSGEEILFPIPDLDRTIIPSTTSNNNNENNNSGGIIISNTNQQQQVQIGSNMSSNNNTGASYSPLSSSSSPQLLSIDDERLLRRLELDEMEPPDEVSGGTTTANIRTLLLGGEEMTEEQQREQTTTSSLLSRNSSNHQFAEQILMTIGNLLHSADRELTHLERDNQDNESSNTNLLGTALVRSCQEFADMISNLAEQLEEQTQDERQALAEACLQDFGSLQMHEEEGGNNDTTASAAAAAKANLVQDDQQMRPPSHDDFHNAIVGAAELLRDVESALRAIEQEEADEIADVALSTAHLFVASLQHIHAQITPQQLAKSMDQASASSELKDHPNIELIEDDDDDTDKERRRRSLRSSTGSTAETNNMQRMRCLWPPVGPAVQNVLQWSKQELSQRHWLLTAALGITMWPAAVITTLVGTPTLLADHVIQSVYNHYQNMPLIVTAEVAAAQMYQTTKLALLSFKIVSKPTLRVAKRQWQRHHSDVQGWIAHKLTHPVDTVVETSHGLVWCTQRLVGIVQDQVDKFQQQQELQKQQALQI